LRIASCPRTPLRNRVLDPMLSPPETKRRGLETSRFAQKVEPKREMEVVREPTLAESQNHLEPEPPRDITSASIHPDEHSEDDESLLSPTTPPPWFSPESRPTYAEVAAPITPSSLKSTPSKLVHFNDDDDGLSLSTPQKPPPSLKSPCIKDDPFVEAPQAPTVDLTDLFQQISALHATMERNASSIRSLERSQSAQWDAALKQMRETSSQITDLRRGQDRLGAVCEELKVAVRSGSVVGSAPSIMGSAPSEVSAISSLCQHEIRRPPRKVGRKIVGYVYEKEDQAARR